MIQWSDYQNKIFNFVLNEKANLLVEALAGSAKTSTIVEAAHRLPENQQTLLSAFNKKIATELKDRSKDHINVATLHSLGFKAIRQQFPSILLNENKVQDIFKEKIKKNQKNRWELINSLCSAVSMCKSRLLISAGEIEDMIAEFDLYPFIVDLDYEEYINNIIYGLNESKKNQSEIDFDDMIYFPAIFKIKLSQFDNVFIDEAQDLTPAQIKFFTKLVKPSGRAFIFGDVNQSIYLFAGADCESINRLASTFTAERLELPICYRCPSAVVAEAKRLVPRIEPYEHAEPGEVVFEPEIDKILKEIKAGDVILSRTNAPLISLGLKLIILKKPCYILGKDFGKNIKNIVTNSKAKTIDQLVKYVDKFFKKEVERFKKKNKLKHVEILNDKKLCIESLLENASSIDDVLANIDKLFESVSDNQKICLSNTHQSKGLEYDNVYMIRNTYSTASREETNLTYVATTRAKKRLIYTKF
jgi:superfamily I DNA/RNA helicase